MIIILGIALISCENDSNTLSTDMIQNPNSAKGIDESAKAPKVEFKKMEHDFGTVIQGERVTYGFRFTNTGNADLLLSKVKTSCGCTATNYPVDPIKPGESKLITVSFNSENRIGFQNKRITVLCNANPSKYVLKIQADIIKPGQ